MPAQLSLLLVHEKKMCVIFCPLDMKGLIGAATVMGSLMYGTGHCWNGRVNMHLRSSTLSECPDDEQFLQSFDHEDGHNDPEAQRRYPPVALAECVADIMIHRRKVRRLHLVIVDLWRPWKVNQAQVKSLTTMLRRLDPCPEAQGTTPMMPVAGKAPLHCRRFVYGYSLDGSDLPCYFLWPLRTTGDSFLLLESPTHPYVDLSQAGFLRPLGIRHFYDAFSLHAEVSIRTAAIDAFQFQPSDVSSDLVISSEAAVARGWAERQEQPVDQNAPEADRRNVPDDVSSVSASEVDSASCHGDDSSYASYSYASYSGESSDTEPPVSEVSDQHSMLEHAYSVASPA